MVLEVVGQLMQSYYSFVDLLWPRRLPRYFTHDTMWPLWVLFLLIIKYSDILVLFLFLTCSPILCAFRGGGGGGVLLYSSGYPQSHNPTSDSQVLGLQVCETISSMACSFS